METTRRHAGLAALLIGLPLLSNLASLALFAPLYAPGHAASTADWQAAGNRVGLLMLGIELLALAAVARLLHSEGKSLRDLVHFQRSQARAYLLTALAALVPTLAAGWLYVRAQSQMGVVLDPARMNTAGIALWYVLTPWVAAFVEETIWRGYAIPRLAGAWRSLLLAGLSFAFFHGFFPLVFLATLAQALVWGWAYRRTGSTLPGMALHLISRYLALIPGLV